MNKTIIGLCIAAFLVLAACQTQQPITNFDECVAAGNPVMESYPEQCRANGQTFVNERQQTETPPLGMPVPGTNTPEMISEDPAGKMRVMPSNEPLPPAVQAAKDFVEQKSGQSAIVLNVQAIDWPDGCIGIIDPAATCLMAITPGYNITVYSGESEYEIHTTADGDVVREANVRETGALAI